jgi:aspartyl-tRNA(Asn)/glutamyl-tRNA(Gln) amidotransferase subunit A
VREAVRRSADTLRGLGARVEDVDLPLVPMAGAVFMALADGEAAAWHHGTLATRGDEYDAGTRRRLVTAALLPATLGQQAARARAAIRTQLWDALARFDVLLAPTAPTAAPPIASAQAPIASRAEAGRRFFNRRSYTTPASLAGVPALSLPCGFTAGGLPIGLQLIGRRFDEVTLLRAGRAYERATDWHTRRPPLPA